MKKLIFIGLAALLAFALVTCDNVQDENIIVGYTNVEYSDDGKNVTIYIDGTTVPVTKAARSLTADLAKKSHDYYEVVFYYDNIAVGGVIEVARAAWEIGEAAAITNVFRTASGINYALTGASEADGSLTTPAADVPAVTGPPNYPAVKSGYAVLFAGRKADKTLLGVGRLTNADGGGVNPNVAATTVTTATAKVTFTVASLTAGAPAFDSTTNTFPAAVTTSSRGSSFWTGEPVGDGMGAGYVTDSDTAADMTNGPINTNLITRPFIVDGKGYTFPAFRLVNKSNDPLYNGGVSDGSVEFMTPAAYRIGCNDLGAANVYTTNQFDAIYKPAIRVFDHTGTTNLAKAENKLPRFPLAGNRYFELKAPWAISTETTIHEDWIDAASAEGNELPNPILFDMTTHNGNDGFISFTFTVPVFAITQTTPSGVEAPITWYIKPGFGTYYYDLDDGNGGPGGSLLIAVGDVIYDSIIIEVVQR